MKETATELLNSDSVQLYNDFPVGVVIFNSEGKILFCNSNCRSLLGECEGRRIDEMAGGVPEFQVTPIADLPKVITAKCRNKGGTSLYLNCNLTQLQNGNFLMVMPDADEQSEKITAIAAQKSAAENLLKSAVIGTGSLEDALHEICRIASHALAVTRVNIWEFAPEYVSITSLLNYDKRAENLLPNATLYRYQLPKYFNLLETEEIIPTKDALNDVNTAELRDSYLAVNGICSLIDVPVRISGKMVGLICFEDTESAREWSASEQKFGLFVAQVVALTIESIRRKHAQTELEKTLDEKKLLLSEVHRRVRSNFALIQDLIKQDVLLAKDEYHKELFNELRNRISSLDMIQRQLYQSGSVGKVNFRDLILDLVSGYRSMQAGAPVNIITTLDHCELSVGKASLAGLLLNEIMMFLLNKTRVRSKENISVRMKIVNTRIELSIHAPIETNQSELETRIPTSFQMAEKLESTLHTQLNSGFTASVSFEI
ncbi:MAG: GAF domain-containing protein [Bacteroidia bacterium]|nr:GAF domain-containing protein [Bacteroidia bacterium]